MRKKKRTRGKKSKNKTVRGRKGRKKRAGAKKAPRGMARGKRAKARRAGWKPALRKRRRGKKPASGRRLAPNWAAPGEKGPGSDTAGQSGDIQGLSGVASVDSESVAELAEEGQAFEAEVVSGVENAPDADAGEVTTKEVPEDDVPPEYRERE
jgi:hypothetical protein